jgi:glycerol dehydrogenase
MIRIVAPDVYDRRPGVLASIADHVAELGGSAFVLGGRTALRLALPQIAASLEARAIPFETETFVGQPTTDLTDRLAEHLKGRGDVVVIGVGGGKALDAAKAAAVLAHRPMVSVPTVPATCAAWAGLSIIYTEEGAQKQVRWLPDAPRRVLVDPEIVATAPTRFLAAGIADTVVKWYEIAPNFAGPTDPIALRLQGAVGTFTLDVLEPIFTGGRDLAAVTRDPALFGDAVDAVIALAGLCGSLKGVKEWGGLAHPFYSSATRQPETHCNLHGAIVGYGMLVQWVLEGRAAAEIERWVERYAHLDLPVTIADLGFVVDAGAKVDALAAEISHRLRASPFEHLTDPAPIAAAIHAVDAIGRRVKAERKG